MFSSSCTAYDTATPQNILQTNDPRSLSVSPPPEAVQHVSRPGRGRPALLQPGLIAMRPYLKHLARTRGGEHVRAPQEARVRTADDLAISHTPFSTQLTA